MNYTRSKSLPSPCRQICQLDAHELCIGCARTRHEIGEWSQAGVERQAEILQAVAMRLAAMGQPSAPIQREPS